jgi:hypothetical protein
VVDQDDADFTRINPAIVPEALAGEIVDGPDRLDPRETTARNHEGEHSLAPIRVGLDAGDFEHSDYPGPEHDRIAKGLDAKRTVRPRLEFLSSSAPQLFPRAGV